MADRPDITLTFLERYPTSSASELGELEATAAADFLAGVPARLAAPVVAHLSPWAAARIADELSAEAGAALFRAMIISDAVPILRLMDDGKVTVILEALPKRVAGAYRTSLDFPLWSVGAWMDHRVISLTVDETAETALKAFRRLSEDAGAYCCVVDGKGGFVGIAEAARLLRVDPRGPLAEIASKRVTTLRGRTPLAYAAQSPDWDWLSALPVLGRKRNPIGRLPRAALAKSAAEAPSGGADAVSVVSAVMGGYAEVIPALLDAALPSPRRQRGR